MEQQQPDDAGSSSEQPSEQTPQPSAEDQRAADQKKRAEQAEALQDKRFWARTRGFAYRHRASLAVVLAVVLIAYAAIVRAAWVNGEQGNSAASSGTNGTSASNVSHQSGPHASAASGGGFGGSSR